MSLEPVTERYSRLKHDLACAYEARPWQSSRIDQIADELVAVERELMATSASDARPGTDRTPMLAAATGDCVGQSQHAGSR